MTNRTTATAGDDWLDAGDHTARLETLEHRLALEDVRDVLDDQSFPGRPE